MISVISSIVSTITRSLNLFSSQNLTWNWRSKHLLNSLNIWKCTWSPSNSSRIHTNSLESWSQQIQSISKPPEFLSKTIKIFCWVIENWEMNLAMSSTERDKPDTSATHLRNPQFWSSETSCKLLNIRSSNSEEIFLIVNNKMRVHAKNKKKKKKKKVNTSMSACKKRLLPERKNKLPIMEKVELSLIKLEPSPES